MFCNSCAAPVIDTAVICPKCGSPIAGRTSSVAIDPNRKDWLTTLLLCIFLGGLGVHRFYTGHTGVGIVQLLTLGGCGIWTIIDLIQIATGSFRDSEGKGLQKR